MNIADYMMFAELLAWRSVSLPCCLHRVGGPSDHENIARISQHKGCQA
jgi:hypothetical protein